MIPHSVCGRVLAVVCATMVLLACPCFVVAANSAPSIETDADGGLVLHVAANAKVHASCAAWCGTVTVGHVRVQVFVRLRVECWQPKEFHSPQLVGGLCAIGVHPLQRRRPARSRDTADAEGHGGPVCLTRVKPSRLRVHDTPLDLY